MNFLNIWFWKKEKKNKHALLSFCRVHENSTFNIYSYFSVRTIYHLWYFGCQTFEWNTHLGPNYFYFLLLIYSWENCSWFRLSKWRLWWIYTFWGPLKTKITFLMVVLCIFVYVCIFYQHNSRANCSRNSKFGILYL